MFLLFVPLLLLVGLRVECVNSDGILYPRESESREVKSLNGIWAFRLDGHNHKHDPELGFKEKWFEQPLADTGDVQMMPVPSSFNDITTQKRVRDHIGWVWYETTFFAPQRWIQDQRKVFLRFGSANYLAVVWLNGEHVTNHTGGHLPFQSDVTRQISYGDNNLLVVAINNTLTETTIPQGTLHQPTDHKRYPKHYVAQTYNFDYFHYAGIHRPVYLYTTPPFYIDDITISTGFTNNSQLLGIVNYSVDYKSNVEENTIDAGVITCLVAVVDKYGNRVAVGRSCSGVINVPAVRLWWPYLSGPPEEEPGYLYTLEVHLFNDAVTQEEDVYRLPFGIRTIHVTNSSFSINGQPFYFRGFGRHEDYNVRGRGVDLAMLVKDHNLLQWLGANSYRTSHYPYAEEILDLTDRLGIVVIDESPAIGLSGFGDQLLTNHLAVMREFVERDKNRPSVVMWSIGNEPQSLQKGSELFFQKVIDETRVLDPQQRPITIVLNQGFYNNSAPSLDVVSINRYFAWYSDTGRSEVIPFQIHEEVEEWHAIYGKPVLVTEYGAGTIAGFHMNPSFVWTEDYQVDFHIAYFNAFDKLRRTKPYFIGEMIWNFADFATPQEHIRPWGCMKGVFTRDRQPKEVAHAVRYRYWTLANETANHPLPQDLRPYNFMTQ